MAPAGIVFSFLESASDITDIDLLAINRLLPQLGGKVQQLEREYLKEVVQHSRVVIARDSNEIPHKIIGLACLVPMHTITGRVGYLTHLVVDESWRRRGIATQLVFMVSEAAKRLGLKRIDLTSGPSRLAATNLYLPPIRTFGPDHK
jgi:N-acetylglutamate synthase-like GNAT family acetyltransferase